jgi:HAD superfamily hydrolase (TIGR01509 family)
MRRFRALIFDVDGTLAETEEIHRRAFNETFAAFGLGWTWDVALYAELLQVAGGKERIRHYQRLAGGLALSDGEVAELHRRKTDRYADLVSGGACALRDGVAKTLAAAAARGQRLAIATTTSRANVEALLAATLGPRGLPLFEVIVAGDEVARKKPAPDVYREALAHLGLPAAACLAIEDSRNGLLAARGAGIPVLIIRSAYFANDDFNGALAVVDRLDPDLALATDGPVADIGGTDAGERPVPDIS